VDETNRVMTKNGNKLSEVESFNYLGFILQKNGGFVENVKHRIIGGWIKWREASGVLCDNRIPMRL